MSSLDISFKADDMYREAKWSDTTTNLEAWPYGNLVCKIEDRPDERWDLCIACSGTQTLLRNVT